MQVKVDINKVEIIQTEQVNSGEYNTRQLQFNIAENMRGLILKALFTKDYKTYEVDIENDSCMIPWEVLKTDGNCELGVYAYSVNGEVLEIRYSPEPTKFYINAGSYKTEVENGEQPTPTRTEVLEGKIEELDNKKVDKKEGYGLSQNDFTNELKTTLENLENYDDTEIKESVENIKNDLTNYYKKNETYSKQEIDNKISKIPKLDIEVVDELPTENISEEVLYLLKSGAESENLYTEYIYVNGKWEKLGEQKLNISHLATKIELEEVKAELNAEIERLTAENQEQQEQINYLDKTLTRAEASGENINIKNSAEYPISEISIDTNIKQDKREGYNEIDTTEFTEGESNGVKLTKNEDGTIVLNGTSTGDTLFRILRTEKSILATGTEKVVINQISGTVSGTVQFVAQDTNYGNIAVARIGTATVQGTLVKDVTYNIFAITVASGTVCNNLKLGLVISSGKTEYEQYGSMPSIEFPSEIKTPVGKQEFYVGNINQLEVFNNFDGGNTSYGMIYVKNEDGSITVNGTSTGYSGAYSKDGFNSTREILKLRANRKYRVYLIIKNKKSTIQTRFYAGSSGNNQLNVSANSNGITYKDFTFTKDLMLNQFSFIGGQQATDVDDTGMIISAMIVDITNGIPNITDFIPHQSQTQDLDLTSELLGPIVDKEDGSYFENRYLRVVMDGTEIITVVSTGTENWYYNINFNNNAKFLLGVQNSVGNAIFSNMYKNDNIISSSTNKGISIYTSAIRIRENTEDTADNFKARLKELYDNGTPLEILYKLATPTYTKLTDEQQAQWNKIKKMHTYEGVTNIYTINENGISPVINMKYVKSPKVVEENLQAQIDKLKNSIISMGGNV